MKVNLNADMGESFGAWKMGDDEALMPWINSANVACGQHAGDPGIMARTVTLARQHGVSVGAHPSFNDLWGFGRRPITMKPDELEHLLVYQIGALQALARAQGISVTHVKPHGSLNNMAHDDAALAKVIARATLAASEPGMPGLILLANIGSAMVAAGKALGLPVALEAYADRRYDREGRLLSRDHPDALIEDPEEACEHVRKMLEAQALFPVSGGRIDSPVHSVCMHGDQAQSFKLARDLRARLLALGYELRSLPDMIGLMLPGRT